VAAVALILSTGCGGGSSYEGAERAAVSGSVTLDGNPLPYGSILFVAQGKNRMASAVIQNGSYAIAEAQGPNLAEYTVQITGYAKAPPAAADGDEEDANAPNPDEASAGEQIVPAQYNAKSTLKVTISAGENTHDFTMTTGGSQ
jgi:hypothetical protein